MGNIQWGTLWWDELFPAVLFGPPARTTLDVGGLEVIRTLNGIHYPVSLLAERVHLFCGRPVYDRHGNAKEQQEIGRVFRAWWDSRRCEVRGVLSIDNPVWLRYLRSLRPSELPGLSPVFGNIRRGPSGASLVEQIRTIRSVDLTDEPLSSGRILGPDAVVECILHCMEFYPRP